MLCESRDDYAIRCHHEHLRQRNPTTKVWIQLKVARGSIRFVGGAGNMLSLQIEGVSFIKFFVVTKLKRKLKIVQVFVEFT